MVCPELTEQIRREIAASLHQRKGDFACYFLSDLVTFTLPAGASHFLSKTLYFTLSGDLFYITFKAVTVLSIPAGFELALAEMFRSGCVFATKPERYENGLQGGGVCTTSPHPLLCKDEVEQ